MPLSAINMYLEELEARRYETRLMMADAATLPHMKHKQRKETLSQWMKAAKIDSTSKAKPASKARLNMMGIGVRHV